jgi:hypothetical protein
VEGSLQLEYGTVVAGWPETAFGLAEVVRAHTLGVPMSRQPREAPGRVMPSTFRARP